MATIKMHIATQLKCADQHKYVTAE